MQTVSRRLSGRRRRGWTAPAQSNGCPLLGRILTVAALVLGLPIPLAAAQTIALFGAQTCQNWLAEPASGGLGRYWVLGGWSGLNLGGVLRHDKADTGHTLTAQDVLSSVQALCQQQPSMPLSEATTRAWARANVNGQ